MEAIKDIFFSPKWWYVFWNLVKFFLPAFLLYLSIRSFIWPPKASLANSDFKRYLVLFLKILGVVYIILFLYCLFLAVRYIYNVAPGSVINDSIMEYIVEGYWNWDSYYYYDFYQIWVLTWIILTTLLFPSGLYYLERIHRKKFLNEGLIAIKNIEKEREELEQRKEELKKYETELSDLEKSLNEKRYKLEQQIRREVREEERENIRKEKLKEISARRKEKNSNSNDLGLFE